MRYVISALRSALGGALLISLALGFSTVHAHHGWGSYDANRPMQITGTVRKATFENPHGLLLLASEDKLWEVVLSPPARMINRGLTIDQIQSGATVEVYGYPHRTNDTEMRAEWIKVHDKVTQLR